MVYNLGKLYLDGGKLLTNFWDFYIQNPKERAGRTGEQRKTDKKKNR